MFTSIKSGDRGRVLWIATNMNTGPGHLVPGPCGPWPLWFLAHMGQGHDISGDPKQGPKGKQKSKKYGQPTRGPRGPRAIFRKWGNPCKIFFWQCLGGNGLAQRPPGHHTIQSPRRNPPQTLWGTISSTKSCFPGPLYFQKGPQPSQNPNPDPGVQNGSRG